MPEAHSCLCAPADEKCFMREKEMARSAWNSAPLPEFTNRDEKMLESLPRALA
jgi:hypothetical protein